MVKSINTAYMVYNQLWDKTQEDIRLENTNSDTRLIEAKAAQHIATKGKKRKLKIQEHQGLIPETNMSSGTVKSSTNNSSARK